MLKPSLVDAHSMTDLAQVESQWRDLAARALEPNPFVEAEFLMPAAETIAPRRLTALCIWEGPDRAKLNGLAILRAPFAPFGSAEIWRSEQAPLASLLVDLQGAGAALDALVEWIALNWPSAVALSLPNIAIDGALARALYAMAARRSLRLELSNARLRAGLPCGSGASFAARLDRKRRKEWARLRRRLEDCGPLDFTWSDEAGAVEDFLLLEAAGWKGARGTALIDDPRRGAFARSMLVAFASGARLRIARLSLNGRVIASGVVLRSGARAYFWKTAFDPAFAQFSPGVQLTLAMSRDLETEPGLGFTDSCADPNHPMIDRIWPARTALADYALATTAGSRPFFPVALAARCAQASARDRIKRLISRRR